MKTTGIIRRIDDLGRVIIPKEIRKSVGIKEGDALEIFTTDDGCVYFKKFASKYESAVNALQTEIQFCSNLEEEDSKQLNELFEKIKTVLIANDL